MRRRPSHGAVQTRPEDMGESEGVGGREGEREAREGDERERRERDESETREG